MLLGESLAFLLYSSSISYKEIPVLSYFCDYNLNDGRLNYISEYCSSNCTSNISNMFLDESLLTLPKPIHIMRVRTTETIIISLYSIPQTVVKLNLKPLEYSSIKNSFPLLLEEFKRCKRQKSGFLPLRNASNYENSKIINRQSLLSSTSEESEQFPGRISANFL